MSIAETTAGSSSSDDYYYDDGDQCDTDTLLEALDDATILEDGRTEGCFLTAQEEQRLGKIIAEGAREEQEQALLRLITANEGTVVRHAKELLHCTRLTLDDLISAGNVGLVQAARSFDYARGIRFSTHAFPKIRGQMLSEIRRYRRTINMHSKAVATLREILKCQEELQVKGEKAYPEDIGSILGLSPWRVDHLLRMNTTRSLSAPTGFRNRKREQTLADNIAAPSTEPPEARLIATEVQEEALKTLDEQTRDVVRANVMLEEPLNAIAARLKISPTTARNKRNNGVKVLKEHVQAGLEEAAPPADSRNSLQFSPAQVNAIFERIYRMHGHQQQTRGRLRDVCGAPAQGGA